VATHGQHKLLNGILIPDFLLSLGIEVSKENVLATKEMFKRYLRVAHTSLLDDNNMQKFCGAFCMISAREFGREIPISEAEKTMTQLLKEYNG